MPQLENDLWIEGGYYIDFDDLDQLRIIGPNNELYMGLIDVPKHKITLSDVASGPKASAKITGSFTAQNVNLYNPAMDDIRTIREITAHPHGHVISFLDLRRKMPIESVPTVVKRWKKNKANYVQFLRTYGSSWYGTTWEFPATVTLRAINRPYKGFRIENKRGKNIPFVITADTNDFSEAPCTCRLLPDNTFNWSVFGRDGLRLREFWQRTNIEISHLISWRKTSGDRFGTIFPRDWMESILLGEGDIQHETVDQMLIECLAHVDSQGQGWHEDVVGEYKYEHELSGKDVFDRKMIDIEPLFMLCIPYASASFWQNQKNVGKLKRVAKYLIRKAQTEPVIVFKKHSEKFQTPQNTYHRVGDWRDSSWAYKQIHQIVGPFSVNASHYPEALRIIYAYAKQLGVSKAQLSDLIKKWEQVRKLYHYTNERGKSAYALAIFDIKKRPFSFNKMKVEHLDEAYLYALGEGSEPEMVHFCKNLIDPDLLFTPSGPTLITKKNTYGYTTTEYHGLVIWAKQAAFAVKALAKHRKIAQQQKWSRATRILIDQAFEKTCASILRAFMTLGAIPELHWDDEGTAKFFNDQIGAISRTSKVQLWSAVGFRRIVREYHDYLSEKR